MQSSTPVEQHLGECDLVRVWLPVGFQRRIGFEYRDSKLQFCLELSKIESYIHIHTLPFTLCMHNIIQISCSLQDHEMQHPFMQMCKQFTTEVQIWLSHNSICWAIWNQWTGLLNGLEYWNGLNCCKKHFS